jgi:hypothetical protein
MKNRLNTVYRKVLVSPLIPELLEKRHANSSEVTVTPAMSAEFRGQRGGYIHTHNSVNISPYSYTEVKRKE